MEKVLGLDLGTNSIGWAVIGRNEDGTCMLIDKGVHIFQDGVAHDKSGEKPAVLERTAARASRRHYFRRRLRKIELLKVLVKEGLCPHLTDEELKKWREDKVYPLNDEFMQWQRSYAEPDKNPYYDRYRSITEKLDLTNIRDRYALGRALYHISQRRGFLSNRKDAADDAENGKMKVGISQLSKEMTEAGCHYLGEYFYNLLQEGSKIRCRYTAREEHYKAEFEAICEKQNLSAQLKTNLERAIFFQRPLRS
ncbi:MAG: CRISPR-associated protein Csn1, partial [Bacteroidales bacterium]|nr:CRISPR-associated protein Csn1 [Bacteroidales bacterium]